jgi:hypothetical protein
LQRAAKAKLDEVPLGLPPGRVQVLAAGSERFKDLGQRQTDLSESPWFYLFFLAILIAEQALAVRLSFHLKGSEAPLPASLTRSAAAA